MNRNLARRHFQDIARGSFPFLLPEERALARPSVQEWLDSPDKGHMPEVSEQARPLLTDASTRNRLLRAAVQDAVENGALWTPTLDQMTTVAWDHFFDRFETLGLTPAVEEWAANQTNNRPLLRLFQHYDAPLFLAKVVTSAPRPNLDLINKALAYPPCAARIGKNAHLRVPDVAHIVKWATDSMELRIPVGAPRGSSSNAAASIRSLLDNGYSLGRRGIEGLFRCATRGAQTDGFAIDCLLKTPNLSRDDFQRLRPIVSRNSSFWPRLAMHPAADVAFLLELHAGLSDSGSDLRVKRVLAGRPEVRDSLELQSELVASRSLPVLRALFNNVGEGRFMPLFRTILSSRPAQAAAILSDIALDNPIRLEPDEIASLLATQDRKLREAVLVHVRTEESSPNTQPPKGPAR